MAKSHEEKLRARDKAFAEHAAIVLAEPDRFSRLKLLRTERGLTQKELGAMRSVMLTPSAISRIEREVSPGTHNSRGRIAYALNVLPEELFGP